MDKVAGATAGGKDITGITALELYTSTVVFLFKG